MFSSSSVSVGDSTKKSFADQLIANDNWNKGRLDTVYSGTNTFAGAKTFSGAITLSSTISVAGASTLSGGVAGETTFQSATTFSGPIVYDGASRVRVTKDNAQTIETITMTIVQYDDIVFDNLGEFGSYKFTAKEAGYYLVTAAFGTSNTTMGLPKYWQISLYKNNALYSKGFRQTYWANSNPWTTSRITDLIYLIATDYIDIRVYHDRGSSISSVAEAETNFFAVHRLS